MLLSELTEYLDDEFAFPVDLDTVVERAGTVQIEGGNTDESESLDTILGSLGSESFESAEALFETIYGNVSDDFIGRKYYDDRGGNPPDVEAGPQETDDISL